MLEINVKKQLGSLALSANLQIPSNGVTALFGLSGSGKSSLINLVSGLSTPDQGYIQLNNRTLVDTTRKINLPPEQRHLGYVFQDARLFPHYTVKGNLAYGKKNVSKAVYQEIIELLGIEHLLKRYPLTLSGGEKQRVAIGRALLTQPQMLLMDEPLAALDLPRKQELLDYLDRLAKEIKIPILYVSHSLEELLRLAQRVILMEQGKVLAFGKLETIWQSPHFLPWKGVQQQSAVFNLPIEMQHPLYQMTALAFGEQHLWIQQVEKSVGDSVRICIYSSDVSIILQPAKGSSIRNVLACQITDIETQAQQVEVRLNADGLQFGASISRWALAELKLSVGMWVYAQVKSVSVIA
ncbi:molybdenum ABC transporter ATP-binding protein ModC [Testudinibacter sp. TR-2022]|uniref:molybdenum ABC transporter ATP-binding protein ModC n=1 Tax=Testudinibacter sp. TR-2022 TaxID=2585029 RepID=UPI001118A850|nr:molybdenum ABC transporter ATP-binding protein ModC [Testudinibacter sp. TR-2022]TNH05459.1 molybdenum ABC transporter ATP-binding protein ModC [Pasteurellaceae bacterium Phil31]TNH09480.1 molybdenum ABC transporter ATP-binding protein ModC [Testudinibacter sp. TR-2022]TNH10590.1 molybdenum ABC transporter ATP-binding protein ModC [Testudinibacter sp. TR-2022]TNH13357.1 molybdenum ABC transporter ATP-binding protein ModC [Testudinibacter sp. TR-2022]TNH16326.1 molybdenum ABC transporter ATP